MALSSLTAVSSFHCHRWKVLTTRLVLPGRLLRQQWPKWCHPTTLCRHVAAPYMDHVRRMYLQTAGICILKNILQSCKHRGVTQTTGEGQPQRLPSLSTSNRKVQQDDAVKDSVKRSRAPSNTGGTATTRGLTSNHAPRNDCRISTKFPQSIGGIDFPPLGSCQGMDL